MTISCDSEQEASVNVIDEYIERFWMTYDTIRSTSDSLMQLRLLDEFYLSEASPGLIGIIEAKRYEPTEFVNMINENPKFLESVRPNTQKAKEYSLALEDW